MPQRAGAGEQCRAQIAAWTAVEFDASRLDNPCFCRPKSKVSGGQSAKRGGRLQEQLAGRPLDRRVGRQLRPRLMAFCPFETLPPAEDAL